MTVHNRRRPARKNSYPLLKQIAEAATDDWWRERLVMYSEGSLPRGVLLNGMVISYVYGSTESHYELSEDLVAAYKEVCAFFAHHTKIGPSTTFESVAKNTNNKVLISEPIKPAKKAKKASTRTTKRASPWASIKSRNRRHALLSLFINMVKQEYDLTLEQCTQLRLALFRADLEGTLAENVVMEQGFVVSVSCVEYNGTAFVYTGTRENRLPIRIAPPPNPIYADYPAKQLDPGAIVDTHLTNLRKKRASMVVKKASLLA